MNEKYHPYAIARMAREFLEAERKGDPRCKLLMQKLQAESALETFQLKFLIHGWQWMAF